MRKPVEYPGLSGVSLRPIGPTARRERTGFTRKGACSGNANFLKTISVC
ncbi:hypothetical protein ACFLZG_01290 [Thermodesulfobacteriota bacterium]